MAHRAARTAYLVGVLRGMRGVHPRECPCCGYQGLFRAFGIPPRFDAQCPRCGALERHRLFVLASQSFDLFGRGAEVLHFAPEPALAVHVRSRVGRYVTADISGIGVDRQENIEALSLPDASFDIVIASHVLEHVDDRRALGEVKRILRPSGVLVCMVPIVEGWDSTYENAGVVTPAGRELHFGQIDHLRYYGRDFRGRLRAAGFSLDEFTADGSLSPRYALMRGEKVFVARSGEAHGVR
jgi:SAM-dependent methyltransferase